MTTNPPPYRRLGGLPKRDHDPASALAAYPINNLLAALDLIRSGRTAQGVAARVPQRIYDSHVRGLRPARLEGAAEPAGRPASDADATDHRQLTAARHGSAA